MSQNGSEAVLYKFNQSLIMGGKTSKRKKLEVQEKSHERNQYDVYEASLDLETANAKIAEQATLIQELESK